jgi:hypothetical protein
VRLDAADGVIDAKFDEGRARAIAQESGGKMGEASAPPPLCGASS